MASRRRRDAAEAARPPLEIAGDGERDARLGPPEDEAAGEDFGPAANDEPRPEAAMPYTGRWRVVESIKYKSTSERVAYALRGAVIDDIGEASALDLFRRGALAPELRAR